MNETPNGIQPHGSLFLTGFSLDPFPTYTYSLDERFQLKKTVFMPYEKNASIILYEVANASENRATVSIAPVVNSRNFHWVTQRDQISWNFIQKASTEVIIQPPNELSTLLLFSTDGRFVDDKREWVESYYRVEEQRGESSFDYNYRTGSFEFDVSPNETKQCSILTVGGRNESEVSRLFSSIYKDPTSVSALYDAELKRRTDLFNSSRERFASIQLEDWLKWLVLATDTFVVGRESTGTKSVIAGYHWFNDWGRDALISLPGLTLVTGRFEDAKKILLTFNRYCRDGLVPNTFPDNAEGTPAYNTVDATLWYFNAVHQYVKYTNDFQFVQEKLWLTLESIIDNHAKGTMFSIQIDNDGLIVHGQQLTWMDAAPDGNPITPRDGKAVEIQALWYNALKIMQLLAKHLGKEDKAETYHLVAEKARTSFLGKFWNQGKNCLFDVIISDTLKDDSLRPNQILAVALDFIMLDKTRAGHVVDTVLKQHLTPYGLKTLSSNDPRYVGKYEGDRWQRDRAYHNGTVWPWLLGPFVTAFLKLRNHEAKWRDFAFKNFLKPLFSQEIYQAGLGSMSEIFDGDPPHEPRGCIAQAWSVAEPLRAYIEDVLLQRPHFEQKVLKLLSE